MSKFLWWFCVYCVRRTVTDSKKIDSVYAFIHTEKSIQISLTFEFSCWICVLCMKKKSNGQNEIRRKSIQLLHTQLINQSKLAERSNFLQFDLQIIHSAYAHTQRNQSKSALTSDDFVFTAWRRRVTDIRIEREICEFYSAFVTMSMKRELREERNGRDSPKEYKMDDLRDSMKSLRSTSRLAMMENELIADSTPWRFSSENVLNGLRGLSQGFVIYPDDRYTSSFLLPLKIESWR